MPPPASSSERAAMDARVEVAVIAIARRPADEDADLLEHLRTPATDKRRHRCVATSTAPPETRTRPRRSCPDRTAEHADLDTAQHVAEQRNRAGRDGSAASVINPLVWARRPSMAPAWNATLWRADVISSRSRARARRYLPMRSPRHASSAGPAHRHQVGQHAGDRCRPDHRAGTCDRWSACVPVRTRRRGVWRGGASRMAVDPRPHRRTVNYANGVTGLGDADCAHGAADRAVCGGCRHPRLAGAGGRRPARGRSPARDSASTSHARRPSRMPTSRAPTSAIRDPAGERGFRPCSSVPGGQGVR